MVHIKKLKPCPFCGNKTPETWWDYQPAKDDIAHNEEYFEGFNIKCCISHVCCIYREEAIEQWNTRTTYE